MAESLAGFAARLGTVARYVVPGSRAQSQLEVDVTVRDAQQRFGRMDVLIEPVAGAGSRWVSVDALRFGDKNLNGKEEE